MIESSMAFILLGFAAYMFWQQHYKARLMHLAWVVSGTRQNRDYLELQNRMSEAARLEKIADALSKGAGFIALKMEMNHPSKIEIGEAAMAASQHDHLVRIGLVEGTNSYAAATDALRWLAKKCDR